LIATTTNNQISQYLPEVLAFALPKEKGPFYCWLAAGAKQKALSFEIVMAPLSRPSLTES
jgi:hypothetical protein